jgi:hypothetical protein
MELVIKSKGENYIVLIDEEDFDRVSNHTWHIQHRSNTKYCQSNIYINGKWKLIKLHRFLMNLKQGDKRVINHIDGNGLNNQKSNLEICDAMYNSQSINTKKNFGCIYILKSGKKKYKALVRINKKLYHKLFYTYAEAESWLEGLKQVAIAETLPFTN